MVLFTCCLLIRIHVCKYIYIYFFVLCLLQERTFQQWEGSRRHQPSPPPPPPCRCHRHALRVPLSRSSVSAAGRRDHQSRTSRTRWVRLLCALHSIVILFYLRNRRHMAHLKDHSSSRVRLALLAACTWGVSYFDCLPLRWRCCSPLSLSSLRVVSKFNSLLFVDCPQVYAVYMVLFFSTWLYSLQFSSLLGAILKK